MADLVWEELERELTEPWVGHPDVWATLSECLDVSRFSPRAAEYVEVARFDPARSDPYAIAANRRDLIYYRLSPAEADILGTWTVPVRSPSWSSTTCRIRRARHRRGRRPGPPAVPGQLLVNGYLDVPALVERALHPRPVWRTKLSDFGKTLSIEWDGAERLVVWLYRNGLRHLFNRVRAPVTLVVSLVGVVGFFSVLASGRFHFTTLSLGVAFAVLLVLDLVIVFIHKLATPPSSSATGAGSSRRASDLLRLSGLLHRVLRRPHAQPAPTDHPGLRRSVLRVRGLRGGRHPARAFPSQA